MRDPQLKICGLRSPRQAAAVAAMGVEALGVIGVPGSPRWLDPAERPALFRAMAQASPHCRGVLVVADPSDDDLPALRPEGGHQVLQLHGDETPERCRELAVELNCEVWKALRIRTPADLERAAAYAGSVELVVLDAWVANQLGGTGQRLPIEWLAAFEPGLPWWLAGGISAGNVAGILAICAPWGLDASSSVEVAPGDKDLNKVEALVKAVRAARTLG